MLKVVTDVEEIKQIQGKWEDILIKYSDLKIEANLKGPSFRKLNTLYWNSKYAIYCRVGRHYKTQREIFWNVFGISRDELVRGADYSIVVEVNFPYIQKRRGKLAGQMAIDENNNVSILHSGKINVSNRLVNIFNFPGAYTGRTVEPEEINDHKKYALVCELSDNQTTVNMIANFVCAMNSAKEIIKNVLILK